MRAAMGDESSSDASASDPLASLAGESPASSPLAAQTDGHHIQDVGPDSAGARGAGLRQHDRPRRSPDHVTVGALTPPTPPSDAAALVRLSTAGITNAGRPPAHMIVAATR